MSIQSLFDLAECTVEVSKNDVVYYSQILEKGDMSDIFNGFYGPTEQMRVSVDDGGQITLTNLDGSTDLADGYLVACIPDAMPVGVPRASGMSAWIILDGQFDQFAECGPDTGNDRISLSYEDSDLPSQKALTPDPAIFTDTSDANTISVFQGEAF